MSKDEIYNKLCEIFYAEEVRLLNRISVLERYVRYHSTDSQALIQLIEVRANLNYFRKYILDVLNYLKMFDR